MRSILDPGNAPSVQRTVNWLRLAMGAVTVVVLIVCLMGLSNLVVHLDAKDMMVVQYPSGTLKVCTQPGYYAQWFGTVTKYRKRSQFWFSSAKDQGRPVDQSISVRFNDGGHARVSGSIAWEMPTSEREAVKLHTLYGSQDAIEQQLVRTVVEKSVYMTGPLMSSKESYAERRNDLISLIDDQIVHGVYKTEIIQEKQKDPITGQDKTVSIVRLIHDANGLFARQDRSPLEEFAVKTFNLAINEVKYDPTVEAQIKQQQDMIMQVQTSIAESKRAEQTALTAAKNGEAEAAKAKWDQEVIKAKLVTEAEARKAVAALDVQTAELRRRELELQGEGEAAKRRAIMQADGALEKKLEVYKSVMHDAFEAVRGYQGNWVPGVVMAGSGPNTQHAGNGAMDMINLMTVKAAQDLNLNLSVPNTGNSSAIRPEQRSAK
jgi:SPFH domain / Band 7 family